MSRKRRIVRWAVAAGVAGAVVSAAVFAVVVIVSYSRAVQTNVGTLGFNQPLRIPPLLAPQTDAGGRKIFDLRFTAGTTELVEGRHSPTWGLNGPYLSPTLRAARGDDVLVHVTNGVGEATTLHWHGMHLPAAMDGGPHQMIEPGETFSPAWTVDQPAATLWFHPHLHGATADHVYRGVAGMFIVDDEAARSLPLPATYGIDDVPLIVQDKNIDSDGALSMSGPFLSSMGALGDTILVNGTHDPHFTVTTTLVRLRLLNASNGRIYNFGFADDRSFWQIATDAGLLEAPHRTARVQLSPGERAEIVVEVDAGGRAVLRSWAPELGAGFWNDRFAGGDDTFDIIELRGADALEESPPLPERLVAIDRPDPAGAAATRTFSLSNNRINGREMDMGRVDEVVTVDTTEIWEITNDHGSPHSFHPHLVHFSVLDVDGAPPPPALAGWKDTVYVAPGTTIRIIARFDRYADPAVPFMFHCHILLHEDQGMMGQFVVVEAGGSPRLPRPAGAGRDHRHGG